ncbi:MAG: hypothetical protein M3318_04410 [Actinomycetota bacterium]|nr:hypothetical protein [Actinomycetota bacterium]
MFGAPWAHIPAAFACPNRMPSPVGRITLHELQRLQAARRTEGNVPPPVALGANVSSVSEEGL